MDDPDYLDRDWNPEGPIGMGNRPPPDVDKLAEFLIATTCKKPNEDCKDYARRVLAKCLATVLATLCGSPVSGAALSACVHNQVPEC